MNKGGGTGNFKLTPEQAREASQLFDTVKLHALANRYNVTIKTLTRAMRREGLLRPKKRVADSLRLPPEKLEQALKLHLEDVPLEKICEAVDSTMWTIRRELKMTGQYKTRRDKCNNAPRKPPGLHHNGTAAQFLSRPLRVVST